MASDLDGPEFSRARPTLYARVEWRIAEVEKQLAKGKTPYQAASWARDKYGLSRRQANKYVAAVFKRQQALAESETPQERRERVRGMLYQTFTECFNVSIPMVVPKGGGISEVELIPGEDLKTAAKLLETIMKFEGLSQPDINISGTNVQVNLIAELQKHYGLEPEGDDG